MHANLLCTQPLEGLMGTQGPNIAGPTVPPSQPVTAPVAAPASGKQAVACIYFQRGHCNRGNWCPFVHAPNSINTIDNKASQGQASAIITEPPSFKNTFVGHERRPTQELKVSHTNSSKRTDLPFQAKPMGKIDSALVKNDAPMKKKVSTASAMDDELRRYRSTIGTSLDDQDHVSWSNRVQQHVSSNEHNSMNGKDTEEVSREPSPALEILVDNELKESDYYHDDQFGRTVDRERRGEYLDGRSTDFSSMLDEQDKYHKSRGYDTYDLHQGQYSREQRRSLSGRTSGRLAYPERRLHGRPESPDQVNESDLRYRLAKQRRANGLRSVINKDYARERFDDRGYQNSRRDSRHDRTREESSLSSRFQGRITRPGRSPATDGTDLQLDRDNEKGRDHMGLSQGRSLLSSRLRDRIKGNLQEDIHIDSHIHRGLLMASDTVSDNNANFDGPKSLAELKSQKNFDRNEQRMNDPLGKRKFSKLDYQQEMVGEVTFKGPMPLEEILKRKKGSGVAVSGRGSFSGDNENTTWKISEESTMKNKGTAETQSQIGHSLPSKNDSDLKNDGNNEHKITTTSDVKDGIEGSLTTDGQSLNPQNVNLGEAEDGMIVEDGTEDQELENYEHGDEDPYYVQGDGEYYNIEEGDNGDPEEEYPEVDDDDDDDDGDDDDDDDDFAKKMGVML